MAAEPSAEGVSELAREVVADLIRLRLTIAVAESLTGGLLVADLISVPGASAVVRGGIVAYDTALKHSLLGVDAALLAEHGAVHPVVAAQMARGVRDRLAVGGVPASIGISTTGVAGPDPQDGQPVGTVFVGIAVGGDTSILSLALEGSRSAIRRTVVYESLKQLKAIVVRDWPAAAAK
jgi:nicotinamide-nucleotide amidase